MDISTTCTIHAFLLEFLSIVSAKYTRGAMKL